TMADRATQALYLLGLDPIAESLADGHSYGFRLERNCADALDQCHKILRGPHGRDTRGPDCVMEGDIKSCFDRISHGWLLDHIFMDREILGKWLKAGYLEKHALFATTEGTPQGGIITPQTILQTALKGAVNKRAGRHLVDDAHLVGVDLDALDQGPDSLPARL